DRRAQPYAQDQGVARGGGARAAQACRAAREPRRPARILPVADADRARDLRGGRTARARVRAKAGGGDRSAGPRGGRTRPRAADGTLARAGRGNRAIERQAIASWFRNSLHFRRESFERILNQTTPDS